MTHVHKFSRPHFFPWNGIARMQRHYVKISCAAFHLPDSWITIGTLQDERAFCNRCLSQTLTWNGYMEKSPKQ